MERGKPSIKAKGRRTAAVDAACLLNSRIEWVRGTKGTRPCGLGATCSPNAKVLAAPRLLSTDATLNLGSCKFLLPVKAAIARAWIHLLHIL